jgi:hypothetical protein
MLGADYISMFNEKCKAIGYTEPVSPSLLAAWKRPNHYISNTTYRGNHGSGFSAQFSILCRSAYKPCKPRQYHVWFQSTPAGKSGLNWGWHNSTPSVTERNDFLRCPHDLVQNTAAVKGPLYFYGKTNGNVHLQMHTNWDDFWKKSAYGSRINMGALQFDLVPDSNSD